jgi:hypothetical protein
VAAKPLLEPAELRWHAISKVPAVFYATPLAEKMQTVALPDSPWFPFRQVLPMQLAVRLFGREIVTTGHA